VGHASLAVSVAAYEQWLSEPDSSLTAILDEEFIALRKYLGPPVS
jgi:hypothetical protein